MSILLKYYHSIIKRFSHRRIRLSIIQAPNPIFFPEKRLILLWNAKAGCTFSIKWMFAQMGLLDEAFAYANWIHKYRIDVFYKSKQQKAGIELFLNEPDTFSAVKIVSDPYRRAVRSYIHACIQPYEDIMISSFLNKEINAKNRFSFREFARYLTSIDITKCNIHHKLQYSEFEENINPQSFHKIKLEDSMQTIPHLEKSLKLKSIDLTPLRESRHHRPKYETTDFMGDVVLNEIYKINKPTVPIYKQFYDEEIKQIISNVYRKDFAQYDFTMELDLANNK